MDNLPGLFSYFIITPYAACTYQNRLVDAILIRTLNITLFYRKLKKKKKKKKKKKNIPELSAFASWPGAMKKLHITKTNLYNFDPLKPHFYIVKLGFTGVYIIFRISAQNIDCGYSLEPPRRGGSNEYPQSMFRAEIWKKYLSFISENVQFLEVKFSIYLYRHVFVMSGSN